MRIIDFSFEHIGLAEKIALQNYETERSYVPALPPAGALFNLTPFAESGLGVAAFEDDGEMVGFLCSVPSFENAFRSTDAVGVFSPMGANGAIGEKRATVYARMYQAVGEKWRAAGASSHAVCLYAHDREAQEQFFRYGFGLRCIDAVRDMSEINAPSCNDFVFSELSSDEWLQILLLHHKLDAHMAASPCFILRPSPSEKSFLDNAVRTHAHFFVAKNRGEVAAFIRVEREGETFVCDTPGYLHITGAFCLPEHRGKGLFQNLLNFANCTLKSEGCVLLGVDFESINPAAYHFWLKYFDAYTHGVVRRIDEHSLSGRQ